jgi:hypothetical protein
LRISHGRLPTAAAVFFDAVLALVDAFGILRRLLRAKLAQHAFAFLAVLERQLLVVFRCFRRPQRRSVRVGSWAERWRIFRPGVHQHAGRQLGRRQLRLAVGILGWFERRRQSR